MELTVWCFVGKGGVGCRDYYTGPLTGLLSNRGEKSIKVWYSKAQLRDHHGNPFPHSLLRTRQAREAPGTNAGEWLCLRPRLRTTAEYICCLILCYITFCYIILYHTLLYDIILYCTIQNCIKKNILYCTILYYTVLYCTILYCTVLD